MPGERAERLEAERHAFAGELGQFIEDEIGLPRMEGRVLGWLMVCSPPWQSAEDLAAALGVSRGAISMALRSLQRMLPGGRIERVDVPGTRRRYYQLHPGMWRKQIDKRAQEAAQVRDVAARGLKRLAGAPPEELRHLRDMHDMFEFLEAGYGELRQRWQQREQEQDGQRE